MPFDVVAGFIDYAAADYAATTAAEVAATDVAATAATDAGVTGLDLGGSGAVAGMTGAEQLAGAVSPELDATGTMAQMAAQQGGINYSSLASILGGAKTAAPIIGGLGQIIGGVGSLQAGRQSGQLAGQADPFGPYRSQYASQLSQLMQNPQTVTSTPGYQFNLAQGLEAQQAQQASQGRLVSGGALLQGQQFGQQLAGQTYQQQLATLASLSGATQSPAAGATAAGQLLQDPNKALATAFQGFGGGAANVINPLQTLYSQYNSQSPSPSA